MLQLNGGKMAKKSAGVSTEDIDSQGKIVNSEDIESQGKTVNYEHKM